MYHILERRKFSIVTTQIFWRLKIEYLIEIKYWNIDLTRLIDGIIESGDSMEKKMVYKVKLNHVGVVKVFTKF